MTDTKWLDFAGFLNGCIHQLHHPHCPFKKYEQMDQYQLLEFLLTVSNMQANAMLRSCLKHHIECKPILMRKHESSWDLSLINQAV